MFILGKKGGGNKYTLISIVLILIVIYVLKLTSPQKEAAYPDIIQYGGLRYQYMESVKGSPIMFVKKKTGSKEGYIILGRRGTSTKDVIYIYEGYLKYRRYTVLRE
ncbi:MAG: hypothetical protein APF77_08505 [Clostridia bacterium BRH_c25]|nr:MAG: hypothetical protein APF77_08505 [Clostridia bacterium BRH_c25]